MEVDTSNVGVVLSQWVADDQKLDPYAFLLRLSSAEINYDIGYCELLMYLVWTDHKPRAPAHLMPISMDVDVSFTSSEDSSFKDFMLSTLLFLCIPISESLICSPFSLRP